VVNEDEYAAGMKSLLNSGGYSWTFWCFDPWWEPKCWSDWQFTGILGTSLPKTGGYHGQYMKDFLYETHNSNLPQGAGGTALPTATRTITRTATLSAKRGDVNGDGQITIVDALMTAQSYVGLITAFSC